MPKLTLAFSRIETRVFIGIRVCNEDFILHRKGKTAINREIKTRWRATTRWTLGVRELQTERNGGGRTWRAFILQGPSKTLRGRNAFLIMDHYTVVTLSRRVGNGDLSFAGDYERGFDSWLPRVTGVLGIRIQMISRNENVPGDHK